MAATHWINLLKVFVIASFSLSSFPVVTYCVVWTKVGISQVSTVYQCLKYFLNRCYLTKSAPATILASTISWKKTFPSTFTTISRPWTHSSKHFYRVCPHNFTDAPESEQHQLKQHQTQQTHQQTISVQFQWRTHMQIKNV